MKKKKLRPWVKELIQFFDRQTENVYTSRDLAAIRHTFETKFGIPSSMSLKKLIATLVRDTYLHSIVIQRENRTSGEGAKTRYAWGEVSPLRIGLSLAKGSYLSHASAMFIQALTEQAPKTIYVNKEQSPKPRARGSLTQPAIDRAFSSSPRTSKYVFQSEGFRFVLLSGKNTGRLEVSEFADVAGGSVMSTKLERTLIDIVVRPTYAGGVYEVLRAYRNAKNRVSVNTLVAILKQLSHTYPYHQSIGYLMERAGFSERSLQKLSVFGTDWNFYLDYGINDRVFNQRWQLYHPKGL